MFQRNDSLESWRGVGEVTVDANAENNGENRVYELQEDVEGALDKFFLPCVSRGLVALEQMVVCFVICMTGWASVIVGLRSSV